MTSAHLRIGKGDVNNSNLPEITDAPVVKAKWLKGDMTRFGTELDMGGREHGGMFRAIP